MYMFLKGLLFNRHANNLPCGQQSTNLPIYRVFQPVYVFRQITVSYWCAIVAFAIFVSRIHFYYPTLNSLSSVHSTKTSFLNNDYTKMCCASNQVLTLALAMELPQTINGIQFCYFFSNNHQTHPALFTYF